MKVIVLGGGIIGTTTAYYLQRQGHAVTVVDRQPGAAMETSFANGGIMSPSQAEPWGAPGVPLKILKWLGQEDAPLLLRPRVIPSILGWGVRFLRSCSEERYWASVKRNLRLALHSAAAFKEIRADTGLRYDEQTNGSLKVYSTAESLDGAARVTELQRAFGLDHKVLSPRECAAVEPALAPSVDRIQGGLHFPQDESGDCFLFAQGLAEICRQRGVAFLWDTGIKGLVREGDRLSGVETDRGRLTADAYVLALGAYSPLLARGVGVTLHVCPVKGYSITVPGEPWPAGPQIPVVDEGRKFGLVRFGSRLRAAGSAEIAGYDTVPSDKRATAILNAAADLFPDFTRCIAAAPPKLWCGLRPVTPDGPPILGRLPPANLFVNTGHGHLGWTLSCGSAKVVAALVSGADPGLDMEGLTHARFGH
jgi:D-amino-acid dehydrogenase